MDSNVAGLEAQIQELGRQIDGLREKRRAIAAERDRKAAEANADRVISGMSAVDAKVMLERLGMKGAQKPVGG